MTPQDGQSGVRSVSDLRNQLEELRGLQLLRCAQALRVIRDTTDGYASNVARRALEEAQIPDPDDESSAPARAECSHPHARYDAASNTLWCPTCCEDV